MLSRPVAIELFSGSKTVSSVLNANAFTCLSLDFNAKLNPDLCCSILDFPAYLFNIDFSFIWASPPCTLFSRAGDSRHWIKHTNKYRIYTYEPATPEARQAIEVIGKTVDIIKHFPKAKFVIENPIGRIQHTAALKSLPHYRYAVNYADFGFPYSKETYLFTNFLLPFSSKKVRSAGPGLRSVRNVKQRSKVPAQLIETIIKYL